MITPLCSFANELQTATPKATRPEANGFEVTMRQASESAGGRKLEGGTMMGGENLKVAFKMSEAQIQEVARREIEERRNEALNLEYAYENRHATVGQVLVNGRLFAEVNDSGGYITESAIPGLNEQLSDPRQRIKEIASKLAGRGTVEIKYQDFAPGWDGWSGPSAPQSMLPVFTARSLQEIMQDLFSAK
jgi:hypothetical protein